MARRYIVDETITTPAAGAHFTWTVPRGMTVRLQCITALFTAANTVLTRSSPSLIIKDSSGNIVGYVTPTGDMTQNVATRVSWGLALVAGGGGATVPNLSVPMNDNTLLGSQWTVTSGLTAMGTTDTWTLIKVSYERVDL